MSETIITKRCCTCKQIKNISEFGRCKSYPDGLNISCRACCRIKSKIYRNSEKGKAAKQRQRHNETTKAYNKIFYKRPAAMKVNRRATRKYRTQHPEKTRAHSAISNAVRDGKLKSASCYQCYICHKQAEQYHHYLSYEPIHHFTVKPVCKACHRTIHLP